MVRFLFQPIEESGNVFFSRTLKRGGQAGGADSVGKGENDDGERESEKEIEGERPPPKG